jgi:REP element-mobilizing transposase RayT
MATYCQLLYHMVWSTHLRKPAFHKDHLREMHGYIHGILKAKGCHVYRIGGVEDHIHILTSIHQSMCASNLVRDVKASSSKWLRGHPHFPDFEWWQDGGGLFTVSWSEKDTVIEYIKNQEAHHRTESFIDEYKRLIREAGLEFREESGGL